MAQVIVTSVVDVNSKAAYLRSKGIVVKVSKTDEGWVLDYKGDESQLEARPDTEPQGETKETVWQSPLARFKQVDAKTFLVNSKDWQKGVVAVQWLRSLGEEVGYFKAKSGKCWVIKVNKY